MNRTNDRDRGWIERPGSTDKLFRLLLAICALLLALDPLDDLGIFHKYVHHGAEGWLGFYSLFGFAAYAFIVGAGWVWRALVGRGPGYYDEAASGENRGTGGPTSGEVSSSGEDSSSGGDSPR